MLVSKFSTWSVESKLLYLVYYFYQAIALKILRENMVDATAIFTLLFGSELFEDYIGHLAVASMASSELTSETDSPEKLQDRLKVRL